MIDLARVPTELFLRALESNLRQLVGPLHKLRIHLLNAVRIRLNAECAGLLLGPFDCGEVVVRGEEALWDPDLAAAFLRREGPAVPATTVLTPLVQGRRVLGVLGAVRREKLSGRSARRTLERLADTLAVELTRREEERQARVLNRIRGKIVSGLRPRDLLYQILDGLRSLIRYDHSSTFLTYNPASSVLRIEAEKIVWTKAKSTWVGHELTVSQAEVEILRQAPALRSFDAAKAAASAAAEAGKGDVFRRLLVHHHSDAVPAVSSLLTAPLYFGEAFLGLLEIAAWRRPPFDGDDLAVVERFLPAAAVSIRNARVSLAVHHVFISYVRENPELVDKIRDALEEQGIEVWLDRDRIKPGTRWKSAIREAIEEGAFFIACFSKEYQMRTRTHMNEEITLAIEELRSMPTDKAWFIPVLLSDTEVPDREIGAGETLRSLQWVDLYKDWDNGIARIIKTISSSLPDSGNRGHQEDKGRR